MMKRFHTAVVRTILMSCCLMAANVAFGQDESHTHSKFGIGISTAFFPTWNPGVPVTPYLFYRHNDHEVLAGADIYGGQLGFASIVGVEAEYRYHFYHLNKNLEVFANLHFQYVRFASGPAQYVPFNYSESISPGLNYSMVRMRSFNNTLGIGLQYSFWKIFALHLNAGAGYHFYRNTLSPEASASYVGDDLLGSRFTFGWMCKIGLSVRLVGN